MQEELQQQMTDALNDQICDDNVQSVEDTFSRLNAQETLPDLKRGIKLPKSPLQWSNANDFFHLTLSNCPVTAQEINKSINTMATVIYNYFSENYGFIDVNNNNVFQSKYKSCSVKELKKALKELKCDNGDIKEIKFVARQLRYLLNKNNIDPLHTNVNVSSEVDHDKLLNNNFWGYIKSFSRKNLNHYQHLISPSVQLILLRHFLQLFQTKRLTFLVGFQSLIPRQHHLISTLRPTMRFQMSFER